MALPAAPTFRRRLSSSELRGRGSFLACGMLTTVLIQKPAQL